MDPIILSSDDENSVLGALAEDRPPSEDEESILLESDETSDDASSEKSDEEEDGAAVDSCEDPATTPKQEEEKRSNHIERFTVAGHSNLRDELDAVTTSEAADSTDKLPPAKKTKTTKKRSPKKERKAGDSKKKRDKISRTKRRNIRLVMKSDDLNKDTLNAQKEEEERVRRLLERSQPATELPHLNSLLSAPPEILSPPSLNGSTTTIITINKPSLTDESVLTQERKTPDVIDLLSSSDEDECVIVGENRTVSPESSVRDDPENSGTHVDDSLNVPDSSGRVLINVGHPNDEEDVYLAPQIANVIKPHQIGGIRFLYDNMVESQNRLKQSSGLGCILAHSMGLGKTIQLVSFTEIFMRLFKNDNRPAQVLIVVPINTLQNWLNEFNMWTPDIPTNENADNGRMFKIHFLNDTHKNIGARARVISNWTKTGGVLMIGYEMFRMLAQCKTRKGRKRKNAGPELVDIDLEEKNAEMQVDMQTALLDPGPDLVICDEGHRIKNSHAGISKSLKQIRTRRRVVLTGYPLQNNLIEYWCMVDFVRPNFLGTRVEFSNMFERPITNGQCADSTAQDVKLMKYRSHVLHSLLLGFVQRRNHKVLQKSLPEKEEWVLLIKMSPAQRRIYNEFMKDIHEKLDDNCIGGNNPLKAFAIACKIWNHPDVLYKFLQSRNEIDLDVDVPLDSTNSKKRAAPKSGADNCGIKRNGSEISLSSILDKQSEHISYDWASNLFSDYRTQCLENSGKFVILFDIIQHTLSLGEKLLVFSQSLMTLNLLEEFLGNTPVPNPDLSGEHWSKNRTYFRLDGSTNTTEREKLINQFNSKDNKIISLFLLSTRAGCLGINLIGANRVVMLDASWNPCHDCQAVCRVYRYGQVRPCFIYRFVTDNTMEKKIYDRQITKQGMADRVVDEVQVSNQFTKKENDQLLEYLDEDSETMNPASLDEVCFDPVLNPVLKQHHSWVTQSPFTHESLLIENADDKLSRNDKKLAREAYEREKKLSASFSRPNYSNFYQNKPAPVFRGPLTPGVNVNQKPRLPTPIPANRMMRPPLPTGPIQIRPGVTVKIVKAARDIVPPGCDGRIIRQGELVTTISTPKGVYIKLDNGKIFAVRNKPGAADTIDVEDESVPSFSQTQIPSQSDHLTNLLSSTSKPFTPNLVPRKKPRTQTNIGSPTSQSDKTDSPPSSGIISGTTGVSMDYTHQLVLRPGMNSSNTSNTFIQNSDDALPNLDSEPTENINNATHNNMMNQTPGYNATTSYSTTNTTQPQFSMSASTSMNGTAYPVMQSHSHPMNGMMPHFNNTMNTSMNGMSDFGNTRTTAMNVMESEYSGGLNGNNVRPETSNPDLVNQYIMSQFNELIQPQPQHMMNYGGELGDLSRIVHMNAPIPYSTTMDDGHMVQPHPWFGAGPFQQTMVNPNSLYQQNHTNDNG